MHPHRLPPRSLALRPGLGTDGGRCCFLLPFSLLYFIVSLLFRYNAQPAPLSMGCLSLLHIFLVCVHLFCPVPVYSSGLFVLSFFIFVAHVYFFNLSCLIPGTVLLLYGPPGIMSVSWCLGVPRGASEPWPAWPRRRGTRCARARQLRVG